MKNKKSALCGLALKSASAAILFSASGLVAADQFGVQIAGAVGDHHIKKLDLGFVWDPDLTWWQIGDWHFSLVGEGHVSWWHSDDGGEHNNIGEIGITPVIRFIKGAGAVRPFVEAGAGVRLLTSTAISESHRMSTAFQFADMVGVGAQFGSRQQYLAGFRFQH